MLPEISLFDHRSNIIKMNDDVVTRDIEDGWVLVIVPEPWIEAEYEGDIEIEEVGSDDGIWEENTSEAP